MSHCAIETIGTPAFPPERFQRVITIGPETQKTVGALPALGIRDDG